MPRLERQHRKVSASNTILPKKPKLPFPETFGEDWEWPESDPEGPKIAFTVTTAESPKQITLWMAYHRALGVSFFYLFVDGQANTPESIALLRKQPGVTVIPNDAKLQEKHAASRIWKDSWLTAFFNKPCNHELFVRQSLNMEYGIELAKEAKADWILHVDTDELIYPAGTRDYSLAQLLASVPSDVTNFVFPNYESLAEHPDVEDPFIEVTLFKRGYTHVQSEAYYGNYARVARGNPNYFTTYGNGKSAARILPGLRPNGAHRWHNYITSPKEWTSDQAAVLHYTYNRFADLKSRRDRCDCKPTEEDAERCFILPFDRIAFLEASLKTDDKLMDFFKQRLVWDNSEDVIDLINRGVFSRLYEPQILIRGLHQAIEMHGGNITLVPRIKISTQTSSSSKTATIVEPKPRPGKTDGAAEAGAAELVTDKPEDDAAKTDLMNVEMQRRAIGRKGGADGAEGGGVGGGEGEQKATATTTATTT